MSTPAAVKPIAHQKDRWNALVSAAPEVAAVVAPLVRAAVSRAGQQQPVAIPGTGSLRDDIVELLRRTNRSRARLGIMMMLQLSGYYAETGTGLADLRSAFLSGRGSAADTVISRAVERGEVDPAKLSPRVLGVPFDLYRQEVLMTLKPVPDEVIESIVDEVFLPLVRPSDSP
jgi:hypothetical protein